MLKQQAHRVTLIPHTWLYRYHDVTELAAQDEQRGAITEMLTRCWPPLRLYLREPGLASYMVICGNQGMDIRIRAVLIFVS